MRTPLIIALSMVFCALIFVLPSGPYLLLFPAGFTALVFAFRGIVRESERDALVARERALRASLDTRSRIGAWQLDRLNAASERNREALQLLQQQRQYSPGFQAVVVEWQATRQARHAAYMAELADEQRHYQSGYEPDGYLNRQLREYGYPPQVVRAPLVLDEGTVYAGLEPGEPLTPIAQQEPPQRENWRTRTPNAGPIAKE